MPLLYHVLAQISMLVTPSGWVGGVQLVLSLSHGLGSW